MRSGIVLSLFVGCEFVLDGASIANADSSSPPSLIEFVCGVCLRSMRDYSVDKRGDVGSWIREVSMLALTDLVTNLARNRTIACFNVIKSQLLVMMLC
jgi:hypothetical protein